MFFKKILKFLIIFILALLLFYLGAEAGYQIKYKIEQWKANKAADVFNKAIIEMFKQDTYGGKTPEETFNMFVDALKNEDIDLAVKYFVLDPDRRANFWKEFNDLKEEGKLKEYADWFPKWENLKQENVKENSLTGYFYWELKEPETKMLPNGAGGFIETTFPAGEYRNSIDFIKNTNGIWKIENL